MAKGPSNGNQGGQVYYRRLEWWNGTTPRFVVGESWLAVQDPQQPAPSYRTYDDIPYGSAFVPDQSGGATLSLGAGGSRLMMAVIRNGYL